MPNCKTGKALGNAGQGSYHKLKTVQHRNRGCIYKMKVDIHTFVSVYFHFTGAGRDKPPPLYLFFDHLCLETNRLLETY